MGWDGRVSVYASPEPQVTTNPAYEEMIVIPSERIFRDGFKPDSWLQVTETSFKQAYAGRGLLGCRCGWMILDSKRCLQHSVVYVQDLLLPRWASTLILFKVFPSCFQLLLESCPPSGCGRQTTHSTAIGKWCFHRKTRTSLPDRQERHVPMIEYILNFKNQDLKRKRFKALERLNLTKFLVHKCKALC